MGFPIKKRINCAEQGECGPVPCGLDLLSAALNGRLMSFAHPKPVPSSSLGPTQAQGAIVPSLTRKAFRVDSEESSALPKAESSPTSASSRSEQSGPFPDILRDILSDPAHESVVSWLPNGQSFAVHDTHKFSSEILPKYFRKVVFRSFARKLNRWGFRSIRKSVSGFEAAFEHILFRRDEPELSRGMKCRRSPEATKSQAAAAAGRAKATHQTQVIPSHPVPLRVQAPSEVAPLLTAPAQTHTERPVISLSSSAAGTARPAPQVPGTAALLAASVLCRHRREEFPADPVRPRSRESAVRALRDAQEKDRAVRRRYEIIVLREELRRRSREREILRLLRETASESDAVTRYIAEKLRRKVLEQQRDCGGY